MKLNSSNRDRLIILALIAFFSVGYRLLYTYRFETSALLYVGFPTAISLILILFTRKSTNEKWTTRYLNHTRSALIVMLGSSVLLFEGFLCVLMFMPIYFGIMAIIFALDLIYRIRTGKKNGTVSVHLLPLILVLSMLEGVSPQLSFDRYNEVSSTRTLKMDIAAIQRNLRKPITLGEDMPGFLSLFPMPYNIEASTFAQGEVHRSHFRYHRWFIANTHEGFIELLLEKVEDQRIEVQVVKDTSYFSNYLTLHGISIDLQPESKSKTKVTFTISYDRKLDPAWYFGPLERFAVEQTAGYLIEQIIDRSGSTKSEN